MLKPLLEIHSVCVVEGNITGSSSSREWKDIHFYRDDECDDATEKWGARENGLNQNKTDLLITVCPPPNFIKMIDLLNFINMPQSFTMSNTWEHISAKRNPASAF